MFKFFHFHIKMDEDDGHFSYMQKKFKYEELKLLTWNP